MLKINMIPFAFQKDIFQAPKGDLLGRKRRHIRSRKVMCCNAGRSFIALHALHTVHGADVSGACRERAAAGGTGQGGYMMPLYINKVNMQKRNKERLYS